MSQIKKNSFYDLIKNTYAEKGYFFSELPAYSNVFGVRNWCTRKKNTFSDSIGVAYIDKNTGDKQIVSFRGTTMPGRTYLIKPINKKGAGIVVPGQYRKAYTLSFHRGKYLALCQRLGKIAVYRDNNLDDVNDLDPDTIEWGFFGMNVHRAGKDWISKYVNLYSAGCQVIARYDDWKIFIDLLQKHRTIHNNIFDYTLFNDFDVYDQLDIKKPVMIGVN